MTTLHPTAIALTLVALCAASGCGQTTGPTADPLTGTWADDACFGSVTKPPGIESCSVELSFMKSLDFELTATWVSLAATDTFPGCTTTRRVTGQTWSTNHDTATLSLKGHGSATLQRSGCVAEEDDVPPVPTTDIALTPGQMPYEVDENTLRILEGSLAGTYER